MMYNKIRQVQEDYTITQLGQIYQQALEDDKRLSLISLIATVIAFLFLLCGGIFVFIGYTPIAVVSTLSSSIPGAFTILFFKQVGESKKHLDKIRMELLDEQKALRAERISNEEWAQINSTVKNISDEKERNRIISVMILQKLGVALDQEVLMPTTPNLSNEGTTKK